MWRYDGKVIARRFCYVLIGHIYTVAFCHVCSTFTGQVRGYFSTAVNDDTDEASVARVWILAEYGRGFLKLCAYL